MVLNKMIYTIRRGGLIMFEVYSKKQLNYGTGGPKDIHMLYYRIDILLGVKGMLLFISLMENKSELKGKDILA